MKVESVSVMILQYGSSGNSTDGGILQFVNKSPAPRYLSDGIMLEIGSHMIQLMLPKFVDEYIQKAYHSLFKVEKLSPLIQPLRSQMHQLLRFSAIRDRNGTVTTVCHGVFLS
jgi:hypothetical protein